jgi:hypothetical protein
MNGLRKCDIYTQEFHLAVKKSVIMLFIGKGMELKIFMVSKINQSHKDKYHMLSFSGS